jgi:hypothetical protein
MTASQLHWSKSLVLFVATGIGIVGCGGGGGSGYPDAVASSGGSSALDAGTGSGGGVGTGSGGTTAGTGGSTATGTGGSSATGTGGSVAPGAPVAIADFPKSYLSATCAFYARCGIFPDAATCEATNWVTAGLLTLQADVAAARITYSAAQAGACVDSIRSTPCTTVEQVAAAAAPSPCTGVFAGTVAAGGTCYVGGECAGSGTCVSAATCTAACCAGTCAAPAASGGSCAFATCPTGMYCRASNMLCTPRATTQGSVCDASDGCAPPLLCIPDATGAGTCGKTLPATGGACNANAGCNDAFHDYCTAAGACAKLVAVGQACTAGTATTSDSCVYYAYCSGGTCKAFGTAGATCVSDPTSGASDCLGSLTCPASLKCTPPPAATSCR